MFLEREKRARDLTGKKAQVSVFIVIAVVIVALVGGYFLLKEKKSGIIGADFNPIEEQFLSCMEDSLKAGIAIMEERGGYIYLPEFSPGSEYMPSSNYLNFLGVGIPYWYYVSGNNIIREQVPDKKEMEEQLEMYTEENLMCDFSSFRERGFEINLEKINPQVKILDTRVQISIDSSLNARFGNESINVKEHDLEIESKLGKFYNIARKIYDKEKQEAFLEKYGLDALYLYAPVNDVELSCSPKIWNFNNVKEEIKKAIEDNTLTLRVNNKNEKRKYFSVDFNSEEEMRFLYFKEWPAKIETQDEDGMLIAEPVGNQPGLGILGFCYVPYHFVYDLIYPVLIQLYDSKEIFQFPVSVIIRGNQARNALPGTSIGEAQSEVCKYKNTKMNIYTYNTNLEPVEADVRFKCLNEVCEIGKTKLQGDEAVLSENFPQCVNGFVVVRADGYSEKKEMISTNIEGNINLILEKLYDLNASLKINDKISNELAVLSFESEDDSRSMVMPEQQVLSLKEGLYNVSVYAYKNSSMRVEGVKTRKCVESVKPGFLGLFGGKEEKCFDLEIPSQEISSVLIAGGKSSIYITETELRKGKVEILVDSLAVPKSIEELQKNYELLEGNKVYLEFKD